MKKILGAVLFAVMVATVPAQALETPPDTENHCVRNLASRVITVNGVQYVVPANTKGRIVQLPTTAGYFIIEWERVFTYAGTMRDDVTDFRALTAHTQFAMCD